MTKKILQIGVVLFFFLFILTGEVFAESAITQELKQTIDKVVEIVADPNLKKSPKYLRVGLMVVTLL